MTCWGRKIKQRMPRRVGHRLYQSQHQVTVSDDELSMESRVFVKSTFGTKYNHTALVCLGTSWPPGWTNPDQHTQKEKHGYPFSVTLSPSVREPWTLPNHAPIRPRDWNSYTYRVPQVHRKPSDTILPCLGDPIKFFTSNPMAFAFTPPREPQ